jgi:hypothetical protein
VSKYELVTDVKKPETKKEQKNYEDDDDDDDEDSDEFDSSKYEIAGDSKKNSKKTIR